MGRGLLLLFLSLRFARVVGTVQTNALFSDGMVIQTSADLPRTKPTTLYGSAAPHEKITLTAPPPGFPGAPYTTTASPDGHWSIQLKPDVPSSATKSLAGSFNITISGSSSSIVARDVVFGDVYLCTGFIVLKLHTTGIGIKVIDKTSISPCRTK